MTEQLLKVGATIGGFSPPIVVGGLIRATFGQWRWYTQEMFVNRILQVLQYDAPAVTAANIDLVSVADPSVTFRIIGVPGATCAVTGFCPPPPPPNGIRAQKGFWEAMSGRYKAIGGPLQGCIGREGISASVFTLLSFSACSLCARWEAHGRGSLPLHNLVSDSANPRYVSDPLPRHRGIIVALHSSEP